MRLNILLPAHETHGIRCGGPDTACRLLALSAGAPSGCTYVEGTSGSKSNDRWEIPAEAVAEEEWQAQRVPVCRALGHPTDGHKGVQQLAVQLDETRKTVASRFEGNAEVHIAMTVNIRP